MFPHFKLLREYWNDRSYDLVILERTVPESWLLLWQICSAFYVVVDAKLVVSGFYLN